MNKKIVLVALLLFPFLQKAFSQAEEIQRGDIHYEFFQFKEAAQDYEAALNMGNSKVEDYLLDRIAQCYKYSFQYKKAEQYFSRLVRMGDGKAAPDVYLDYGAILKINGDYNRARDQFKYYQTFFPDDPFANAQIRSLTWAIRNKDSLRNFTTVPANLNISGQSLGYCFYDDGLIYSTQRNKIGKENTVQMFDLDFAVIKDSITFVEGDKFMDAISFELNEGSPSITDDGMLVYFSANATKVRNGVVKKKVGAIEISSDGVSNLKIYVAKFENGKFVSPQELPFNNKEYNCMHPSIADNGNTLYFVSDMPKGFGGLDIYKVKRGEDGKWGKPENLGEGINTTENEMYPFVSKNVFFFASKGLNGFGGYDLFQAKINLGVVGSPINMGHPFNSSYDDVAFICRADGRTGYLSSNRENGEGIDNVYYFYDNNLLKEIPKPAAIAAVTPKPEVKVETPKPIAVVKPKNENPPAVVVAKTEQPKVVAVPKPVETKPAKVQPKPIAIAKVSDDDLTKIKFEEVPFKFNDVSIPQSSYVMLDSAIRVSRLSKMVKIEISAHTDSRGSAEYNKKLSERRALSAKMYLIKKGVAQSRIITHGFGETQLLNQCADGVECTEEQHALNRRVEVKIVK